MEDIIAKNLVGATWLAAKLKLTNYPITHQSFLGTRLKKVEDEKGCITEIFPPLYTPGDSVLDHIAFLIKYDDLNLDFLKSVFRQVDPQEVAAFVNLKPLGIYERKIGFLFEFLTGLQVPVSTRPKSNYVNLLDEKRYITGRILKNQRWLVNDNLLGSPAFCPIVRRTTVLQNLLMEDFPKLFRDMAGDFPPEIFQRALNYLYTKETRSSYEIENEKPTLSRVERFVQLLERAGEQPLNVLLSEANLTRLQNEIVDARFAASGFRTFQNYIGQTTASYKQMIHYICPPPQYTGELMHGLSASASKMENTLPLVRAAVTAFGFVFIHPFEDGNGRLHRFLIHDMLIRAGLVSKGMIIPVSAHMVSNLRDYDMALETFSKPLHEKIRYDIHDDYSLNVTNAAEVKGYYQYPDMTALCIYLGNTMKATIVEDMRDEMTFLLKYDEAKNALRDIVDMPDKDLDLIIRLLHQNQGLLARGKRKHFDKLTEVEISRMEKGFQEIFMKYRVV